MKKRYRGKLPNFDGVQGYCNKPYPFHVMEVGDVFPISEDELKEAKLKASMFGRLCSPKCVWVFEKYQTNEGQVFYKALRIK